MLGLCAVGCVLAAAPRTAFAVAWRWPIYCFFASGGVDLTDRCHMILRATVDSWHREQEGRQYKSDVINPTDPYAPPYTAQLRILGYAPDAASPQMLTG